MRARIVTFCYTQPDATVYKETMSFPAETTNQDIDDAYYDWLITQVDGCWEED
jgi:hypothetical protein